MSESRDGATPEGGSPQGGSGGSPYGPADGAAAGRADGAAGGAGPVRRAPRGLIAALVVTALLALYMWAVTERALALIRIGEPLATAIGVAILALPVLVLAFVVPEFRLAARVQSMADRLAATGDLPVDDLPRSAGGRIDRDAADALFAERRAEVEAAPGDWRGWFHLAFAYDAAGDRRRARATLRRASRLYRPREVQQ